MSLTMLHLPRTPRVAGRSFCGVFAIFALATAVWSAPIKTAAKGRAVWIRLELVENTVEGPAFDRCTVEGNLKGHDSHRWRVFYGQAQARADASWEALRPGSGCTAIDSERAPDPWALPGSPYLLADITVEAGAASEHGVALDVSLTLRRLTGYAYTGAPVYEERTEKRTLQAPAEDSAVVPILVAGQKEIDEFRVRELLLKFRARAEGLRPPVEYGEVAVAADIPRAEIFLDGGFVGRTSSDGPVVLGAVRAGEREVIVQDASGREARSVARVEKGRRTSVSLTLMKDSPASGNGLRLLGRNPQGGDEFWREKDGAIVVRIPGGEFQMGSPEAEGDAPEHPRHAVRVNGFLMDKTEVTWGQYKRFLAASSQPPPKSPVWGMPEALPVSSITWPEASAFCSWTGGRLPTEAEWERAARGDDSRRYPWGNTFDPWRCNTRDGGPHAPTPAGAYPDCVSPYGVLDLAGSVQEWCSDWYGEKYYRESPSENPTGPGSGTRRVSRGGNWMNAAFLVRAAYRMGIVGPMMGFRCAQEDRKGDGK